MKNMLRCLLVALAIWPGSTTSLQAREPVDLLLVLAADVSRSVDAPKFQLQRTPQRFLTLRFSMRLSRDCMAALPSVLSNGQVQQRKKSSLIGP